MLHATLTITTHSIPTDSDLNSLGIVFGGWTLANIDRAGSNIAVNIAGKSVTYTINNMKFKRPIYSKERVYFHSTLISIDGSEIEVHVSVTVTRDNKHVEVAKADVCYVAIDDKGQRRQIDNC